MSISLPQSLFPKTNIRFGNNNIQTQKQRLETLLTNTKLPQAAVSIENDSQGHNTLVITADHAPNFTSLVLLSEKPEPRAFIDSKRVNDEAPFIFEYSFEGTPVKIEQNPDMHANTWQDVFDAFKYR